MKRYNVADVFSVSLAEESDIYAWAFIPLLEVNVFYYDITVKPMDRFSECPMDLLS